MVTFRNKTVCNAIVAHTVAVVHNTAAWHAQNNCQDSELIKQRSNSITTKWSTIHAMHINQANSNIIPGRYEVPREICDMICGKSILGKLAAICLRALRHWNALWRDNFIFGIRALIAHYTVVIVVICNETTNDCTTRTTTTQRHHIAFLNWAIFSLYNNNHQIKLICAT